MAARRPIGAGGLGLDDRGRHRQPDLLLPGPVDHPDRVQDPHRRAGGAAGLVLHADARELRPGLQPLLQRRGRGDRHRLRRLLLQLDLHRRHRGADRPGDRHARRLRLLALPAQGQRHLPVHHPEHPDDAGDRRHHPDLPDVPGDRPRRQLHRHHPALRRLQPAVHHLDDEELLRRDLARRRGRGPHGRQQRAQDLHRASACRRSGPASPPPSCSA